MIGREARNLTANDALSAVLGYTVANDVSASDQSALDSFWTQTKNSENFSPIGPWIDTDFGLSCCFRGCFRGALTAARRFPSRRYEYGTYLLRLGPPFE